MLKAFKYRIYPTKAQEVLIQKHFGCVRWVYNWGLNKKVEAYKSDKKSISRFELQKELPILKLQEETKWLKEVNAQTLQISLEHLDKSFVRFFRQKNGFPNFKSKHYNRKSYQCFDGVYVKFNENKIKLPKLKLVKVIFSRRFEGQIKTTTVSQTPTGKYFVSILVDVPVNPPKLRKPKIKTAIGIDTGIKTFLTLSDGTTFENNRYLKSSIERLKVLQRRASKKVKGSANRKKANLRVAKIHEKIANQRLDYIHKITHRLTSDNQTSAICIEDLNVKGMMKNHNLAQTLSDVSLSKFYEILKYKCEWQGINLLTIGRFEPSSKTCCKCGHIKKDLTLSVRDFECDKCGNKIDRDLQAAINITDFAFHPKNKTGAGSSEVLVEELPLGNPLKQEYVNRKSEI